jgi:hypothetical protein
MRHSSGVKAFLCLPLLFGAAWADEAADRTAIARTVAALNEFPQRIELFTPDADARPVLNQLWKGKRLVYRMQSRATNTASPSLSGHPTVTISHEPWGEATINFAGMAGMQRVELSNPRIVGSNIRFITLDVALADGALTYDDGNTTAQTTPLLFVMKKQGADWKIASIRILTPR